MNTLNYGLEYRTDGVLVATMTLTLANVSGAKKAHKALTDKKTSIPFDSLLQNHPYESVKGLTGLALVLKEPIAHTPDAQEFVIEPITRLAGELNLPVCDLLFEEGYITYIYVMMDPDAPEDVPPEEAKEQLAQSRYLKNVIPLTFSITVQ